jgi:hypothetical protein
MSLFPPEEIGFYRLVEQTFLVLKGSGLMLSATDAERVRGWEATGVPARVVCDALEHGFEAYAQRNPGASKPTSLAYFRKTVESAIRGWREREVG